MSDHPSFNLEKKSEAKKTEFRPKELLQLWHRLKKESVPENPDLVYLFGQTRQNQSSVLDGVSKFFSSSVPISLSGHEVETSGAPAFPEWKEELKHRGVVEERIVPIPGTVIKTQDGKSLIHSLSEAQALVRYAREKRIKDVVVVASPWHLPRTFVSTVSVALREYPELKVYALRGTTLEWGEKVSGSQGTLFGTRLNFIVAEMHRIKTYYEKGDLVSPEEVLVYMDKRDGKI